MIDEINNEKLTIQYLILIVQN